MFSIRRQQKLARIASHRRRFSTGRWYKRTLRAEELARDVEGLAADNNDLLAGEELLSNNGGEATEEVALAIDDDL